MLRLLLFSALGLNVFLAMARGQNTDSTTVLTYNMGLPGNTTFTLFYQERRDAQFSAIDDTGADSPWANADVVCLQEVFLDDDMTEIQQRASGVGYNYSFAGTLENVTQLRGSPACSSVPILQAFNCISTNCPNGTDIPTTLPCSLGICSDLISVLKQSCVNCIAEGTGSLTSIVTACLSADAADYPTNLGLMLLSKKEIISSSLVAYNATADIFRRGYIRSEIKDVGTVFCTHMFPTFDSIAALRPLFERTNLAQMRVLVDAAKSVRNAIVAGDLNLGPANLATNVTALYPGNFALASTAGFSNPYSDGASATCTFCASNPLNVVVQQQTSVTYNSEILDHIFVKPSEFTVMSASVKRVFTANVVPISGLPFPVPLSDHYGVQVTLIPNAGTTAHLSAVLCYLVAAIFLIGVL